MKEGLSIEQQQQTVQRLSPRQVQFVRLLEMSAPEIEEEVRRQLDDNPALEIVTSTAETEQPGEGSEIRETPINDDPDDDPADYRRPSGNYADETYIPQIVDDDASLYNYLLDQLSEYDLPDDIRRIATYIIGNIDENGYITRTLAAMAEDIEIATGYSPSEQAMRQAFDTVRNLDPAGICAVDLRDCLLLQLRRMQAENTGRGEDAPRSQSWAQRHLDGRGEDAPRSQSWAQRHLDGRAEDAPRSSRLVNVAEEIVADYFDLLSKKHYDRLQAQAGIADRQTMQRALNLIRSLNPKPGSSIAASQTDLRISQITPDVEVERSDDGRYTVSLVNALPQLQIESTFRVDPQTTSTSQRVNARQQQAKAFVKLKRDDAEAFISALQQRSNTLLSVAEAIVKLQPEFFESGQSASLRPMILKDVANLTGLDLSVISRATAGKYITTATGTYPMKMFFNEAPKDDSEASSHQILDVLSEVIAGEDKRHPMSDEALCEAMAKRGYNIARRTITKYRERLGIPVGRLRKEAT